MRQDLRRLGRVAVDQIIKAIEAVHDREGTCETKGVLLKPALVVRESSRVREENVIPG
jgi:DNA-binding LacI/PurR family transcriptional regulator